MACLAGRAQSVSFDRDEWLLAPATGHVPFVDCVVDMDGDFRDDVVRVCREGLFIDFQVSDGTFTQRYFPLPIQVQPTWSICAGDLDMDGYNDLLFAGDSAVSFVLSRDHGRLFEESVMTGYLLSQRSTLADIDLDGWLDGFVCNDKGRSVAYHNAGQGVMQPDTLLVRNEDQAGNYAAIWTDYDNDSDIDLYITKCQAGAPPGHVNRTNLLYRNNGDGTFTETAAAAGLADNAQSWATVFEDFDNDGDFDAFVVNHDEANRLYRNNGDGTFTDVIESSGIDAADLAAFENSSGDFNNDGFVDIFAQLDQAIYLGHGDLTFTGIDVPVTPGAIGDLNGDGWLDVFRLGEAWINQPGVNHWLKVALIGMQGNRNGIGSRIEIHGAWGRQVREVRAGQSYTPMSSLNVHFGLGSFDRIDSLVVQWPSGVRTILRDLPSDTLLVVAEASCNGPMVDVTPAGPVYLCVGDTLPLTAPSGYESYQWTGGPEGKTLSVDRPGTYRALCLDTGGCVSVSREVLVIGARDETPVIFAPDGLGFCPGDSVTLAIRPGLHPTWSNGIQETLVIRTGAPGNYSVAVDGWCSGNSSVSDTVQLVQVPVVPPVPGEVSFLPGDSVRLTADGEECHWFDQPAGGNELGVGSILHSALPDTSVTFYVENHIFYQPGELSGGKTDTAGAGGIPLQNGHLEFEVFAPCTLGSVTVYLPSGMPGGVRFIQLWSRDSLVAFRRFDVTEGANQLALDFALDTGKYWLVCPQGNLFRNTGQLDYPYRLGEYGRITSSSTGTGTYFYFYDWRLRGPVIECVSERIPMEVVISSSPGGLSSDSDLKVFPVPTAGVIHLLLPSDSGYSAVFQLLDAQGQVLRAGSLVGGQEVLLDISTWPDGFYWMRLAGSGGTIVRPVVKNSRSGK